MQNFGRVKVSHQKLVIPEITVFMSSKRPAKERDLALQELSLALTFSIRGSQLAIVSFLVQRGTLRYLIGRVPWERPVSRWRSSISCCERPEVKKQDFETLIPSPECASKFWRTSRTLLIDRVEPSVRIRRSSAKHKWVSFVSSQRWW